MQFSLLFANVYPHQSFPLYGIGKATVLKKLLTFTLCLGDLSASLDEVKDSYLRFVVALYGKDIIKQNACRHLQKKNYWPTQYTTQAEQPATLYHKQTPLPVYPFPNSIWKAAGMSLPLDLNPLQYSWGDELIRTLTGFYPNRAVTALDELLNLVSCGCKTG